MEIIKSLHILGVSLFIGNIIVSGFWKAFADRIDNISLIKYSIKLVNLTDIIFTGFGSTLLLISGHIMAKDFGGIVSQDWIVYSYILFGASGLLWLSVLVPIQIKQSKLIKALPNSAIVPESYYKLSKIWSIVGIIATILPLPAIYFMVSKTL